MFKKNVPFIEQMSQTECGIACIAMISAYYDHHIPLTEIREKIGNGRDGNTLLDLYRMSKDMGFVSKCYKSNVDMLSTVQLPAIVFWDFKHFVVLQKEKKGKFSIIDPSSGRKTLTKQEFAHHFSHYILEMVPSGDFEKRKEDKLWTPYIKLLLKRKKLLGWLFLFSLFLQSFSVLTPMFIEKIIDSLLKNDKDILSLFLLGILVSFSSYLIFNLIRNEFSIKLYKFIDFELSERYFSHLLKLPYSFYQVRQSGDLLYRFSNLRSIRNILSNSIMQNVLDGLLLVVITIYMFMKSTYLSFFMIILSLILIVFIIILRPFLHEMNRNELTKDTDLYSFQSEAIMGVMNIKVSGTEQYIQKRWGNFYKNFAEVFVKKERLFGLMTSVTGALTYFIPIFIVWIGSHKVVNGTITIGELIAFQAISSYFISTSNSLILSIESFYQLKVYLRRIKDVLDTSVEKNNELSPFYKVQGNIKFENVSFSYTKYSQPIIEDISLNIQNGDKVAIIGPSGSGKSTLAKLLVGLHQPSAGKVYFDSKEISDLNKTTLRSQIGVVTQDLFLFNQSIKDNIKMNREGITDEDVIEAASKALIHEEIMKMPMGYETIISEKGQNLSGGQRQRIAIASALVTKPKILLLDEATNALDSINEKKIDEYLSNLNCTRIVIAHRLSTIKDANFIIVLDYGRIVGKGTHSHLLKYNSYYKRLYEQNSNLDLKGGEQNEKNSKGLEKSLY
ncbi:peptidase domain-containing ABC transporter [Priestia endophytica]|uniref:peptidase domain-containing ABC transporter n=1 Tax=Priestia endophytica TaxID=135735 RepID=UPI00178C2A0B|nr:peptidase domain-containing ABC transporter [Priestia endophytica]